MRVLAMGLAAGLLVGVGAAQGPARVSGGVMAGQILTKVAPVYPVEAKAQGVEGTVVLHAVIGRDGAIASLQMVSGPEMLQASAWDAVKQWVYRPYLLNGQPTEVETTITLNYNLGGVPGAAGSLGGVPGGMNTPAPAAAMAWKERDPNAPVRVSGGVMAGQILTNSAPLYPPIAHAAGVSGAVVLHAVIGPEGTVRKLEVIAGPEMLRAAALESVRQWTYKPYLLNGEAVAVDTTVTVNFQVGGLGVLGAEPR